MIYIGLGAVAILVFIVLYAIRDIQRKGYESSQPQCTPSRINYTSYPSKRYRWHGLERSFREEVTTPPLDLDQE